MSAPRAAAAAVALLMLSVPARAEDTAAKSQIVGVDLFKNGLAVVAREVTLGKPGTYVLDDVPEPVHGTYWVESTGKVETLVKMRDVEVAADTTPPGDLQTDLAGKAVTIHFKGDRRAPVTGTVMKFKPVPASETALYPGLPPAPVRFLVLKSAKGRVYVDAAEIAAVEAGEAGDTVTRQKPRLVLTLAATEKPETKVTIRYLTRGLGWAPSYRIDITDPKTLTLEQNAVVKNELADLSGASVRLISGFPSIQFAHVLSPLAPRTTWVAFFQQLNSWGGRNNDVMGNAVVMQQSISNVRSGLDFPGIGAVPTGEGVDLHYQPIGKRTLAEGETLALTVASGKAEYERIVEWLVPDTRDAYGHEGGRGRGEHETDDAWDALKFKNPLTFPMTTGPATVTAGGEFNGQRTSFWVNAGEETVLRVNKALSVRTRAAEHEQAKAGDASRELIWIGGRQFRRSTVEGELNVGNHRKEEIKLVLRRRFSGELVSAEGAPKTSLREEGVYTVNKRNEMVWTLALKAGEDRKLKYTYTVLIPF